MVGVDRNRPRRVVAAVKMTRTNASAPGLPGPIPRAWRERRSRRSSPGRRLARDGPGRRRGGGERQRGGVGRGELGLGLERGEPGGERRAGQVRSSVGLLIRRGATATCEGSTATAAWAGRHGYRSKKKKRNSRNPPVSIFFNCKKVQQQF